MSLIKRILRYLADKADIKLNYAWVGMGQHDLILDDPNFKNNIPKTVFFNTRSGNIKVGTNTVFGDDVMVLTGKHRFISEVEDVTDLQSVPEDGRDIQIGDNCYIGSRAIIIGPVTIGDFSVIAAGAVVTKDVPSRQMFGGVPAKLIKNFE